MEVREVLMRMSHCELVVNESVKFSNAAENNSGHSTIGTCPHRSNHTIDELQSNRKKPSAASGGVTMSWRPHTKSAGHLIEDN